MTHEKLLLSSLNKLHESANAKMSDQAGWSIPMSFSGVIEEYQAATTRAAIFDVSHIGRIRLRGFASIDLLEKVCTADVAHQEDNTAIPTLLLNEKAGIFDICILTRLENMWILTTSPVNRLKVLAYLSELAADYPGCKVDDQSTKVGQLAAVGPQAKTILDAVLPIKVAHLPAGTAKMGSMLIARYIASRTNYAKQWGLEVMLPGMLISKAWTYITQKAGDRAMTPAGCACREILRIEAGLPRYGHEISEMIDPVSAGLMRLVDMSHDFIGKPALQKLADRNPARKRCMLKFDNIAGTPSLPRLGDPIFAGDREIGNITSSTLSPASDTILAMGYLASDFAKPGQPVAVKRGELENAFVSEVF